MSFMCLLLYIESAAEASTPQSEAVVTGALYPGRRRRTDAEWKPDMPLSSAQAAELFVRRAPGLVAPLGSVLALENENHEAGVVPSICNGGAGARDGWGHESGDADSLACSCERDVFGTAASRTDEQHADSANLQAQVDGVKTSSRRYREQASVTLACRALIRRYSAAVTSPSSADTPATYEAQECGWDDGESVLLIWIERRLLEKGITRSIGYDDFRPRYAPHPCCDNNVPTVSGAVGSGRSSTKRLSGSSFFSDSSFSRERVSTLASTGSRGIVPENAKPCGSEAADPPAVRLDGTCPPNSAVVADSPPSGVLSKTHPAPKESDSLVTRWVQRGRSLTDEGRLEGWKEEQLVVRAAVRPKQIVSQLRSGVRRMSKKVTFSLDHQEAKCRQGDTAAKSSTRRGGQRRYSRDSASCRGHPASSSASEQGEVVGEQRGSSDYEEQAKFLPSLTPCRRPAERKATHRTGRRSYGGPASQTDPSDRRSRRAHSASSGSRRRHLLSPLPLLLELLDDDEPLLGSIILEPKPDHESGAAGVRQHASGLLSGGSGTGLGGGGGLLLTHYSPGFPSGVHRQYHPSDRPEVLFPQARARHLRRHFERHGSAAFTSTCSQPSAEDERSRASSGAMPSRQSRPSTPPGGTPLSSFSVASSTGSGRSRSNSRGPMDSGSVGFGSDSEWASCDTPRKPVCTRAVGAGSEVCRAATAEAVSSQDGQEKRPRFRGRLLRFLSHWKLPPVTSAAEDWYPAPAAGERRIHVNKILMATPRDRRDLPLFPFQSINDQGVCSQSSDGCVGAFPGSSSSEGLAGGRSSEDASLSGCGTLAVGLSSCSSSEQLQERNGDAWSDAVALSTAEASGVPRRLVEGSEGGTATRGLEDVQGCQERKPRLIEEKNAWQYKESGSHHEVTAAAKHGRGGGTISTDACCTSDQTFLELAKDNNADLRQKMSAGKKRGFARRLATFLRRGEGKAGVK